MKNKMIAGFRIAAVTLLLAACATNPVTGKKELMLVGEGQEITIGASSARFSFARRKPVAARPGSSSCEMS
jgi:hypothetical protein